MKIVKQLKRNEIKLIDWLINILVLQILCEQIQARTKKLLKQKKLDSWKNYVFSVNVNTHSKKV